MEQGCLCHHCSPYPHRNPSGLPQVLPSPFLRSLCNFSSSWDIVEPVQYGEGTGKPFKHPSSAGLGAGVEERRGTGRKGNDGNSRPPQLLRTPPPHHQTQKTVHSPFTRIQTNRVMHNRTRRMYRHMMTLCNQLGAWAESENGLDRAGTGAEAGQVTYKRSTPPLRPLVLTNTINSSVTYAHSSQYHQQL